MRSYEMTEIGARGLDDLPRRGVRDRARRLRRGVPLRRHRRLRPGPRAGHRHPRAGRAVLARSCSTPSAGSACELPVVGIDVVEVSPPYDHAEITAFLANRVVPRGAVRAWPPRKVGITHDPAGPLLEGR